MNKINFWIFVLLTTFSSVYAKKDIKQAIVKIYTVYNRPDYYNPWEMEGQRDITGSGVIIEGDKILTTAHIVSDATFIQVKLAGRTKKFPAEVEIVAHDCDLAILKVKDKDFFENTTRLHLGDLPYPRDKVAVYGFPIGGDELCITEGVISRIEHRRYAHSRINLLICQMDAAINPGSSGGPVIKGNKVVGIAFQYGSGENISYMIPVPVIKRFLKDIQDGKYDGVPDLCISWEELENFDIREKYGLYKDQSGILVTKVYPVGNIKKVLKEDDIILSIDKMNIANDATVEFRPGERTSFLYTIQNKCIGDKISLSVLREGKIENLTLDLDVPVNLWRLVLHEQYDVLPTYYIIGGLVFSPLTLNFLKEWRDWWSDAPKHLVNYYLYGEPTEERRQVIILVQVLADEVNMGYQDFRFNVISKVNNKKVSTMEDLVLAFETNTEKYHVIEDENNNKIVLNRKKVEIANKRILEKYKIKSDRSEDLKKKL